MYSVLIVDDEKLTRDWLVRMIGWNGLGFSVAGCCGNGKEALEFLENSGADLIITDIKMPVCDGISMLEQIRRKGIRSPVLLLTGFGEFEYAMAAIQNGVSDYLLKPIEEEKLTAAVLKIRKQLDGRREESGSSAREQYYEIRERLDEMIRSGKAAGTVISLLERVWKNRTYRLYGLSFEHEEEKSGSCREALQKCIGTLKESCPVYELCTDGLILLAAVSDGRETGFDSIRKMLAEAALIAGISESRGYEEPEKFLDAVNEAKQIVPYQFYHGKKALLRADLQQIVVKTGFVPDRELLGLEQKLFQLLIEENVAALDFNANLLRKKIDRMKYYDPDEIREYYIRLIKSAIRQFVWADYI